MKFSLENLHNSPFGKWFFPALLLVAGLTVSVQLLLPASLQVHCLFRRWTGFPCPTCGGTRCLRQILGGDFVSAFQMQPLIFILIFAGGAVLVYLAGAGLAGLPIVRVRLENRRERVAVAVLLIVPVLFNWIYLICCST